MDPLSVDGIDGDDALLVSGPPLTGKYQLMLRLLAEHADSAILVSTKHQADRVREDYREFAGDTPEDRIGIIDCASYHDTVDRADETETTKYVSSPQNMTDIGVKFTELFEAFHDEPDAGHVGVGVHSISQLLMHANMKKVYRFMQVLTGQVRSAGWFGAAVVDSSVEDEEELRMLQHHFDGVIETRENEDGEREFRVRGVTPQTSEWTGF